MKPLKSKPATQVNLNPDTSLDANGQPLSKATMAIWISQDESGRDGKWLKISYQRMALDLEISYSACERYFSRRAKGKRLPRLPLAHRLAKYLGVSLDQLYRSLGTGISLLGPGPQ